MSAAARLEKRAWGTPALRKVAPHLTSRPAPVPREGRCRALRVLNGVTITYGDLSLAAAAAERVRVAAAAAAQLNGLVGASKLPSAAAGSKPLSGNARAPAATHRRRGARRASMSGPLRARGVGSQPKRAGGGKSPGDAPTNRRPRPASARPARPASPSSTAAGSQRQLLRVDSSASVGAKAATPRAGQTMSEFIRARQEGEMASQEASERRGLIKARVDSFLLTGRTTDAVVSGSGDPAEPEHPDSDGVAKPAPPPSWQATWTAARAGMVLKESLTMPLKHRGQPGQPPRSAAHIAASQEEFEVRGY